MSTDDTVQKAFGRPGNEPTWTCSSKEGVGTAYSISSNVWYTISHGNLTEIYYPTIDRPQVRTMQFLVTDSHSFLHDEFHDFNHQINLLNQDTQGFIIISESPDHRYRIIKEILANPQQPCVLMHVRVEGDEEVLKNIKLYAILDPHLEAGGMGNTGQKRTISGQNILMAYKASTFMAWGVDVGFVQTSCGFEGKSEGLTDIRKNLKMTYHFDLAENGNIALTGEIDLSQRKDFIMGIGFGKTAHSAIAVLMQTLSFPFEQQRQGFLKQWNEVQTDPYQLAKVSGDDGYLFGISHRIILTHEDKLHPGAFVASASIPWGQVKGDEDIGGYHMVWVRDMVQSATALLAMGDMVTPHRAMIYLACIQNDDGNFPQNFWVDGNAHWYGVQLDQTAYPIILAWRLWKENALYDFDPYPIVCKAVGFLVNYEPYTLEDRWEHYSGYSPSALTAMIVALICASDFAKDRGNNVLADFLLGCADFLESHIEEWTTTTQGDLHPEISRHYILTLPMGQGNKKSQEDPNTAELALFNQKPGNPSTIPARNIVSCDFLELVRFGIRDPHSSLIEDSLKVIDSILKVDTPSGPCWHRYNYDGYGEKSDGSPYTNWGIGRAWPLLTGERGHYELAAKHDPRPFLLSMEAFSSPHGLLPEQVWDTEDIPEKNLYLGKPTGSAQPLVWAHAEYIKLLRSVKDGHVFDQIPSVAERYLGGKGRKDLEIWKFMRQIQKIKPGKTLRIQAKANFRLHWTMDEWNHTQETSSMDTGIEIYFVDIKIPESSKGSICFTFFWEDAGHWEGRNFTIEIE